MPDTISSNSVVVAIKNQVSSNLGEEAVILHLGKGAYYGINEVGTFVWNLLQKPVKVDDIVREITSRYEVAGKQCETDLMDLLKKLLRAKLIEISTR